MTQLQKLELNKRVDKILHAPANVTIKGQQPEMAFVPDLGSDIDYLNSTLKDAAASLKAHDKIFQNIRSNVVYWGGEKIATEVTSMSFIQIGKVTEALKSKSTDNLIEFDSLCAYLKLYHARCRCILLFTDSPERIYNIQNKDRAKEGLNPFLKHRLLIITPEKMITGSELLLGLMR